MFYKGSWKDGSSGTSLHEWLMITIKQGWARIEAFGRVEQLRNNDIFQVGVSSQSVYSEKDIFLFPL